MSNSRLVYSTDGGDRRRRERRTRDEVPDAPADGGDGIVRVSHEKRARGKVVTLVRGLPTADLEPIARELKRLCGSGGAADGGVVELQGDHRRRVAAHLEERGHRVRLEGD